MNKYELWNGKKVVGYRELSELCGKYIEFRYFEKVDSFKIKTIKCNVAYRMIDYCTWRVVVDVRHKSKRQLKIILDNK